MDPIYDIFRDFPDSGPIWIESIQGLENATGRLRNILEIRPGDYFVYDTASAKIVAATSEPGATAPPAKLNGNGRQPVRSQTAH